MSRAERKGVISPVDIWIPRRAPNLNDLFRAKATPYGKRGANGYAALKRDWAETVMLYTLKRRTPIGRCLVHFEIIEPDQRRDPDNIAAGAAKLILDGLVKVGVLEGDGWAHIAGLSFSWRVGKPAGVLVTLTPEVAG